MKHKVLLIEDVDNLGRSGELVLVQPGYARNYLLPKQKGVIATSTTLKLQEALQEKRRKQSAKDKEEDLLLASRIHGMRFEIAVKIDPAGHMYGSVTAADILARIQKEGFSLSKQAVTLAQPFKKLGEHVVLLKLKEGVTASVTIGIVKEII